MEASRELPKYRSHKIIWALKIASFAEIFGDRSIMIKPADAGYAPFRTKPDYAARVLRNDASDFGYFVQYADGYQSWSPTSVFESGYTLVSDEKTGGFTADEVATDNILQYFAYSHLPPHLQARSKPFSDLARVIIDTVPRNPERSVALRKLLEAKDAAVRAAVT